LICRKVFYWCKKYLSILLLIASVCRINILTAQSDSVKTIFKHTPSIKLPIRYSYLQWDLGYKGFFFQNTYLGGLNIDLIGVVFNDNIDVAIGIQHAGGTQGFIGQVPTNTVQTYSALFLKFEPILFPVKLLNVSFPLELSASTISLNNALNGGYGGYGRRHRGGGFGFGNGYSFFAFSPGVLGLVNIFKGISVGMGANYRIALSENGSLSSQDYDNFSLSVIVRLKLFTKRKPKSNSKQNNDYYTPPQRFQ
jgi:hypothetical protein